MQELFLVALVLKSFSDVITLIQNGRALTSAWTVFSTSLPFQEINCLIWRSLLWRIFKVPNYLWSYLVMGKVQFISSHENFIHTLLLLCSTGSVFLFGFDIMDVRPIILFCVSALLNILQRTKWVTFITQQHLLIIVIKFLKLLICRGFKSLLWELPFALTWLSLLSEIYWRLIKLLCQSF